MGGGKNAGPKLATVHLLALWPQSEASRCHTCRTGSVVSCVTELPWGETRKNNRALYRVKELLELPLTKRFQRLLLGGGVLCLYSFESPQKREEGIRCSRKGKTGALGDNSGLKHKGTVSFVTRQEGWPSETTARWWTYQLDKAVV